MIKPNDKEITKRLLEIKNDKRLKSNRAFALSINTDPSFFAKILKGEKSITDKVVENIGKRWAVTEKWLLHGTGQKYGAFVPRETTSAEFDPGYNTSIKDRVTAYDALLSVLVAEIAALRASVSGEHAEVITKKIYKAAEDLQKLQSGG